MTSETSSSWVTVGGLGDPELAQQLAVRVEARRSAGEFTLENQRYVALLNRALISGVCRISPRHSDLLRRMCTLQPGAVQLHQVRSHRKYLGPVIVACKKMLYRVVKPLIDPMLQQQREFNALSLYLLADIANEVGSQRGPVEQVVSGDSMESASTATL